MKLTEDIKKATIVKVGTIDSDGVLTGWIFDGRGECTGTVLGQPALYGGYTSEELKEIYNKSVLD